MRFCKKCHKMIVKEIINPNTTFRVCDCDCSDDISLSEDVKRKLKVMIVTRGNRSKRRYFGAIMRKIDEEDGIKSDEQST